MLQRFGGLTYRGHCAVNIINKYEKLNVNKEEYQ